MSGTIPEVWRKAKLTGNPGPSEAYEWLIQSVFTKETCDTTRIAATAILGGRMFTAVVIARSADRIHCS